MLTPVVFERWQHRTSVSVFSTTTPGAAPSTVRSTPLGQSELRQRAPSSAFSQWSSLAPATRVLLSDWVIWGGSTMQRRLTIIAAAACLVGVLGLSILQPPPTSALSVPRLEPSERFAELLVI